MDHVIDEFHEGSHVTLTLSGLMKGREFGEICKIWARARQTLLRRFV